MLRKLIFCFGTLLVAALAAPVYAVERQKIPPILKIVENFVRSETAGFPGQVSFSLGIVDPHLNLQPCRALEPFLPSGTRLWGQASVGVRCNEQAGWTLYVPVTVKVMADVVHTVKPLAQGQPVGAADITLQKTDLAQLPGGALINIEQSLGKTLVNNIAAGQPLRQDILRAPLVIQQGQTVQLRVQGQGFNVHSEGKALAAAADGQVVQVRIPSGRIISGVARPDAIVEIRP